MQRKAMKIYQFIAIFVSVFVSVECVEVSAKPKRLAESNQVEIGGKIVNGNPAILGQFPYQAAILLVDFNGDIFVCGGSLIKYNWVLSTAFCMDKSWPNVYVTLGTIDLNNGTYAWRSPDIPEYNRNLHPAFDRSNFRNNIGLIFMDTASESLLFHPYIDLIPLPIRSDVNVSFVYMTGLIAGYGLTGANSGGFLYYTSLPLVERLICVRYFAGLVHSRNLCADTFNRRSPCAGDTGSGIVTVVNGRTLIAGIYSFSPQTCDSGIPAVFEDVAGHLDWIDAVLDGIYFNVTTNYPTTQASASMAKLGFVSLIAFLVIVIVNAN